MVSKPETNSKVFKQEFDELRRGEWLEYYRGDLQFDRQLGTYAHIIDLVAGIAYDKYKVGKAILCQRKHGPRDYSYFVVKR